MPNPSSTSWMNYACWCWKVILTFWGSLKLDFTTGLTTLSSIPNNNLLRKDRDDRHGGVAIYGHNRLEVNQIHFPDLQCTKVESLWIKLSLPNTRPIYAGIVYGPNICNTFFEELEAVLDDILAQSAALRTNGEIICLGDFNCDFLKPNDWQWKKLMM